MGILELKDPLFMTIRYHFMTMFSEIQFNFKVVKKERISGMIFFWI